MNLQKLRQRVDKALRDMQLICENLDTAMRRVQRHQLDLRSFEQALQSDKDAPGASASTGIWAGSQVGTIIADVLVRNPTLRLEEHRVHTFHAGWSFFRHNLTEERIEDLPPGKGAAAAMLLTANASRAANVTWNRRVRNAKSRTAAECTDVFIMP